MFPEEILVWKKLSCFLKRYLFGKNKLFFYEVVIREMTVFAVSVIGNVWCNYD